MHILTVLKAINYNIDQPMAELRKYFKKFIAELQQHKVLGPKTKIYAEDVVYFDIVPPSKLLPQKKTSTVG